jgi:hypothetical protein
MSVIMKDGAAFLTSAAAAVVIRGADGEVYGPPAKKTFTQPEKVEINSSVPWARWGRDNDLPNKMYADCFENAGVLSAGVDIISRIAMGRTCLPVQVTSTDVDGKEVLEPVNDNKILDWLEENNIKTFSYETILDALKTGHVFSQLISNKGRDRINRIRRTDASICRLGKFTVDGTIDKLYMSYEWCGGKAVSADGKIVKSLPLLDRYNPIRDLLDDGDNIKDLPAEFAVTSNYPLFNRQYYCVPQWFSVRKWVDIVMSVPQMKAYMFNNQMTIKYVIEIDEQYWTSRFKGWGGFTDKEQEKKRSEVLEEFDAFLSGNENAYKSLMTGTKLNPVTGTSTPFLKITSLDDKIKDGKLLPESAAGNSEILFALMLNPALLGVDMPGGMYSGGKGGSNIRESFMVQILIREIEREFVIKPLLVVAKVNGWKQQYPRLGFRFPNHYLTTLDTGKNAQPIM